MTYEENMRRKMQKMREEGIDPSELTPSQAMMMARYILNPNSK